MTWKLKWFCTILILEACAIHSISGGTFNSKPKTPKISSPSSPTKNGQPFNMGASGSSSFKPSGSITPSLTGRSQNSGFINPTNSNVGRRNSLTLSDTPSLLNPSRRNSLTLPSTGQLGAFSSNQGLSTLPSLPGVSSNLGRRHSMSSLPSRSSTNPLGTGTYSSNPGMSTQTGTSSNSGRRNSMSSFNSQSLTNPLGTGTTTVNQGLSTLSRTSSNLGRTNPIVPSQSSTNELGTRTFNLNRGLSTVPETSSNPGRRNSFSGLESPGSGLQGRRSSVPNLPSFGSGSTKPPAGYSTNSNSMWNNGNPASGLSSASQSSYQSRRTSQTSSVNGVPGDFTKSDMRVVNSDGRMDNCGYACLAGQTRVTTDKLLDKHNLHNQYATPGLNANQMLSMSQKEYPGATVLGTGTSVDLKNYLQNNLQPGETKKLGLLYQHPAPATSGHFLNMKAWKPNQPNAQVDGRIMDFQQPPSSRFSSVFPPAEQDTFTAFEFKRQRPPGSGPGR